MAGGDVNSTAERALTEVAASRKQWTKPSVAILNLSNTAGGINPSFIEFEIMFLNISLCMTGAINCS